MKLTIHPTVRCTCCNEPMIRKSNSKGGGVFYGCSNFAVTGCTVTWSETNQCYYGDPSMVAPASALRGRCTSLRSKLIAFFTSQGLGSANEVDEFITAVGLVEAQALVA